MDEIKKHEFTCDYKTSFCCKKDVFQGCNKNCCIDHMHNSNLCLECKPKLDSKKKVNCCKNFCLFFMLAIIGGLITSLVYYEETLIFIGDIINVDLLQMSGY